MTGGKLGGKQSERIVKMVSKPPGNLYSIYLPICISSRCPLLNSVILCYHTMLQYNII